MGVVLLFPKSAQSFMSDHRLCPFFWSYFLTILEPTSCFITFLYRLGGGVWWDLCRWSFYIQSSGVTSNFPVYDVASANLIAGLSMWGFESRWSFSNTSRPKINGAKRENPARGALMALADNRDLAEEVSLPDGAGHREIPLCVFCGRPQNKSFSSCILGCVQFVKKRCLAGFIRFFICTTVFSGPVIEIFFF